jgi:hypothetical protein
MVGSWGPQIAAYARHVVTYGLQYPWRVFAAGLVAILLLDLMSMVAETKTVCQGALPLPSVRVQRSHHADPREHQPAAASFRGMDQVLDRDLPPHFVLFGFR